MLDALRFVQGAVAKKDFVPTLTHFRIENGLVRGFNGAMALCSPINLDMAVSPKALPFIKAIQTCKETIQLHVTPAGKLAIKSGNFKAFVECIQEPFPETNPEGIEVILPGNLLGALKILSPFIAEDASRPWARGILFRGQSAYATNNIVVMEYWLGYNIPIEINIPRSAVAELLRIGKEPERLQVAENSTTFHFKDGRWLRTQTNSTQWPDLNPILSKECVPTEIVSQLWESLESLIPFVDETEKVRFIGNAVATGVTSEDGASVELSGIPDNGCFNIHQLLLLKGVATSIDWNLYPAPCIFYGKAVRGAVVGMRN